VQRPRPFRERWTIRTRVTIPPVCSLSQVRRVGLRAAQGRRGGWAPAGSRRSSRSSSTALPVELEEVLVNATERGRLREFYARKQQRHTFARFLEYDEDSARLAPSTPASCSQLFRESRSALRRLGAISNTHPRLPADGVGRRSALFPARNWMMSSKRQKIGGDRVLPVLRWDPGAVHWIPPIALCGLILVWTRSQ